MSKRKAVAYSTLITASVVAFFTAIAAYPNIAGTVAMIMLGAGIVGFIFYVAYITLTEWGA